MAYLRTARREPENIDSLLKQLNACHKAAFARHTAIAEVFIDYGVAGNKPERPGIYEMLAKLDADPSIGYVITADHARIGRSPAVSAIIEHQIADAGCHLVYATGNHQDQLPQREQAS